MTWWADALKFLDDTNPMRMAGEAIGTGGDKNKQAKLDAARQQGLKDMGASTLPTADTSSQSDVLNKMLAFYQKLTGPLDMNDPQVKSILNGAYSATSASGAAEGILGPANTAGAQQGYIDAAAGLQAQRQQIAAGLLGQAGGLSGNIAGMNYQSGYNQYIASQNEDQTMASLFTAPLKIASGRPSPSMMPASYGPVTPTSGPGLLPTNTAPNNLNSQGYIPPSGAGSY